MMAAREGTEEMIDMLIKSGAEIFASDKNGHSALMHSVMEGNCSSAKKLIESKAAFGLNGVKALIVAAKQDDYEISKLLIAAGVDVRSAIDIANSKKDFDTSRKLRSYLLEDHKQVAKEVESPSAVLSPLSAKVLSNDKSEQQKERI